MTAIPTRALQQQMNGFSVKVQRLVVAQMTAIRAAPSLSSGEIDIIQVQLHTASSVR